MPCGGSWEYYKDLAFPAASLVFCILGVPVGIVSKRSAASAGLPSACSSSSPTTSSMSPASFVTTLWISPFAGAWLPNVIFTIVTILWFYRVSRQ